LRGFRYLGGVARVIGVWSLAMGVALAASSGCSRGAKTPEDAYQRLSQAVAARDGARLFDALDLETRWSWMTVQRAHRESYDITLSTFPEGPERERQMRRFETGALASSAQQLFARQLPAETWTELASLVAGQPRFSAEPMSATAEVNGKTLLFRKSTNSRWGWGYAGLADQAEQIKRRALADLEMVRTSAADYERAATRQAK
jgi:hypothetical protein